MSENWKLVSLRNKLVHDFIHRHEDKQSLIGQTLSFKHVNGLSFDILITKKHIILAYVELLNQELSDLIKILKLNSFSDIKIMSIKIIDIVENILYYDNEEIVDIGKHASKLPSDLDSYPLFKTMFEKHAPNRYNRNQIEELISIIMSIKFYRNSLFHQSFYDSDYKDPNSKIILAKRAGKETGTYTGFQTYTLKIYDGFRNFIYDCKHILRFYLMDGIDDPTYFTLVVKDSVEGFRKILNMLKDNYGENSNNLQSIDKFNNKSYIIKRKLFGDFKLVRNDKCIDEAEELKILHEESDDGLETLNKKFELLYQIYIKQQRILKTYEEKSEAMNKVVDKINYHFNSKKKFVPDPNFKLSI